MKMGWISHGWCQGVEFNSCKDNNPKIYGDHFDTISVCLSKGLGCPVGSVLAGRKQFMDKALRIRKILGGGMRQVGYLAAAGLYAIENNLKRLAIDHKRAKEIASGFLSKNCIKSVNEVETNIIIQNLMMLQISKQLLIIFPKKKYYLTGILWDPKR